MKLKRVSFSNAIAGKNPRNKQSTKEQTFEADAKSFTTENTRSTTSSVSFLSGGSYFAMHHEHQKLMKSKENDKYMPPSMEDERDLRHDSSQTKIFLINDLMRSNRSLEEENKKMKAKIKDMEQSLHQRRTVEDQELIDAIEVLQEVIKQQEKKWRASKKAEEKHKSKILECDDLIERLEKERDALQSSCLEKEEKCLALHEEVSSLQQELAHSIDHIAECSSQLEYQKMINADLSEQIADLESELPALNLTAVTLAQEIKDDMTNTSFSTLEYTSEKSTDELNVMNHMAKLEDKVKRRREQKIRRRREEEMKKY